MDTRSRAFPGSSYPQLVSISSHLTSRSLGDCLELDTSSVPEDPVIASEFPLPPNGPPAPPDGPDSPDHSPLEGTVAGLLEALVVEDPSVEEMEEFCCHFISNLGTDAAPWVI